MGFRETAEGHQRLQHQLAEERMAALVRISRRLEALIAKLHAIRERVAVAAAPPEQELSAYRATHAEAVKYRWFLEVQRESLGILNHRGLDEFYRVPPLDL